MKRKKQGTSLSLMLRMIDVVFILLFGFIAVSQITVAEAAKPPESTETTALAPVGKDVLIIRVDDEGKYAIDGQDITFQSFKEMARFLEHTKDSRTLAGKELNVRIRLSWDSQIEHCLKIARLCRDLDIPKGIDINYRKALGNE